MRGLAGIAFLSAVSLAAFAQSQLKFEEPAADPHGPVTGKPYTAHKLEHQRRFLADGTVSTHDFRVTEARDANGIVATASQEIYSGGVEQHIPVEFHTVFDPLQHTLLQWTNLAQRGQMIHLPVPSPMLEGAGSAGQKDPNAPKTRVEQLGHRVIDGITCNGIRATTTVAGTAMGAASEVTTTREVWRDDALQLVVASTETNPRNGTSTSELVDVTPGAPDPALFHLPAGYSVTDIHPHSPGVDSRAVLAAAGPDPASLPTMTYAEAFGKMDDPANRAIAAAVLVKMAGADEDPVQKDKVAYAVARANLQLPAAEALARAAVNVAEQRVASASQTLPLPHNTAMAEHRMARYWDTLGYILEREGGEGVRYLAAAWVLDPRAYYGSHLGRAYENMGDSKSALTVYRAALQEDDSSDLKQNMQDRIEALSGPGAAPAALSTTAPSSAALQEDTVAIQYGPGAAKPQVHFLSTGAPTAAEQAFAAARVAEWSAPDTGPETVTRFVALRCTGSGGDSCTARNLSIPMDR
ncbi:MAG TPA: hypothetical protein VHZ09_19435 [Acidobacteriaceae bacterium]|jgi:hypothetical protein|nr:hypothetical protein [Acidobacteriaceae bacterium]